MGLGWGEERLLGGQPGSWEGVLLEPTLQPRRQVPAYPEKQEVAQQTSHAFHPRSEGSGLLVEAAL